MMIDHWYVRVVSGKGATIDMRVRYLSDFGGEQLRQSDQQHQAAAANRAAWQGEYQQAHHELATARRNKPLWKRVLSVSSPEEQAARARTAATWQQAYQAGHHEQHAFNQLQQRGAGVAGEQLLEWGLSGLSDDWTMLRGYRNRRGETDHVLVGPLGVWAVEVKRRRIRLHAVGDEWWYEKLSARGHTVETEWAVDGGGRSWARQVTDIALDLEAWLARRGQPVPVETAVMVMHEQAQPGQCQNPGVDLVGFHPQHLLDAIVRFATPLTPQACQEITRLVERDHHYHAQRRRRR